VHPSFAPRARRGGARCVAGQRPATHRNGPRLQVSSTPAHRLETRTTRPGRLADGVEARVPVGSRLVHRPARRWPAEPSPQMLTLPPPPPRPEEPSSRLARVLPLLGSLSVVAFALLVRSLLYLIVIAATVIAVVAGGLLTTALEQRRTRRRTARTAALYRDHVARLADEASEAAVAQRAALLTRYPDPGALLALVRDGERLWERRPTDPDFVDLRVGLGRQPARVQVNWGSVDPLVDADPELREIGDRLVGLTTALGDVPIVVPARTLGVLGVVGPPQRTRALATAWLAALAALHAPSELRIAGLVGLPSVRAFDWLKWLPHCRDPLAGEGLGRVQRAVTTDPERFAALVTELVRTRRTETEPAPSPGRPGGGSTLASNEHVVLLVDGYDPAHPVARLDTLMARAHEIGITALVLVDDARDLPTTVGGRLEIGADGVGRYDEAGPNGRRIDGIVVDQLDVSAASELARTLAPLVLTTERTGVDLSDPVRLLELLGVERANDLVNRHRLGPADFADGLPAGFLRAPIGRREDGSVLELDLNEAAHSGMGPHGLLVGATGSGKSELLRSLVASLAAGHDPAVLSFLLVDFKGGAAFGELAGLPHVAGLVTNLADDLAQLERVRAALLGELARRQQALHDAGGLDSLATYCQRRARGAPLDALSHLVIVVDEFGELLAARPDFTEVFLTLARVGRSLGVHLLLASQRLDEGRIRSLEGHLRYRLCLRTFTAQESRAVLGDTLAFDLPAQPGLGYLKVDGAPTLFKSALVAMPELRPTAPALGPARAGESQPGATGGPGARLQPAGRPLDLRSLCRPLALAPAVVERPERTSRPPEGAESESDLVALVRVLSGAGDPPTRRIFLEPLPPLVPLGSLFDVAATQTGARTGAPDGSPRGARSGESGRPPKHRIPLALVDRPSRQDRGVLSFDPESSSGNVGIAGGPGAGATTAIQSLVLALATAHGPDRLHVYGIDLAGGGLRVLEGLPHVGGVVGRGDPEALRRLVRELTALVEERAAGRVERGSAAAVYLVIDGAGRLRQLDPDVELQVSELASSGLPYGIHVVASVSRWSELRPAFLDALGLRIELRLADPGDSLYGRSAARLLPADIPGRGLGPGGELLQVAWPDLDPTPDGEGRGDLSPTVGASLARSVSWLASRSRGTHAPVIRALPRQVARADVAGLAAAAGSPPPTGNGFLLGVAEFRSRPIELDLLGPGRHLLLYGDAGSGRTTVLRRVLDFLDDSAAGPTRHLERTHPSNTGSVAVHLVDPARGLLDLAERPSVATYAATRTAAEQLATRLAAVVRERLPPETATVRDLLRGPVWPGPVHVLLVDDYDLLCGALGGPFGELVDLLAFSRDVGLHVVLARRVAGSQRAAFEPFSQRLREVAPIVLVLSGSPEEGPVAAGLTARPFPPGRGLLRIDRQPAQVVQCCLAEPRETDTGRCSTGGADDGQTGSDRRLPPASRPTPVRPSIREPVPPGETERGKRSSTPAARSAGDGIVGQ